MFLWFQDALDILQGHGMVEYLKFALVHLILLLNKHMKLYLKNLDRKKMITKISFLTSRSWTSEIFWLFHIVWFDLSIHNWFLIFLLYWLFLDIYDFCTHAVIIFNLWVSNQVEIKEKKIITVVELKVGTWNYRVDVELN